VAQAGVAAETLEVRVRQLEDELRRVERERDILKKALAIFGRCD
jgi:transposase